MKFHLRRELIDGIFLVIEIKVNLMQISGISEYLKINDVIISLSTYFCRYLEV